MDQKAYGKVLGERVSKLRAKSLSTPPSISLERALIETDVYERFEGRVSIPELRALTLYELMARRTLYLGEDELIVGEKGDSPQAAPTFPELCCHTIEDMKLMDSRPLISFKCSQETLDKQEERIIPFWDSRSMRKKLLGSMSPEWHRCYAAGIFTEFMEQRGPGHTVGSGKIYEKGFEDFKAEIQAALNALNPARDPEALAKAEQLRAMSICCDAIMLLGDRYAAYAEELAGKEPDPLRQAELMQIADNCRVVPRHRPQTYWQAIQMYWFVHLGVTIELNPWDAYSPGRLDQHLYPFYEKDLQDGRLSREEALELLECLWVKFNNQPAPPKVGITLKESGTYTDFANINTGGITADGFDGVNEVSYLILDCMEAMKLLQPSSNVQISRKTPLHFVKRACEIARQGWGQPAFYNTEAIIQEQLNAGKSLEDARLGGTSGCVETGAFGNEAYILTGYFNIPKVLEITLHGGIDPRSGEQLGLKLGSAADFDSYEALYEAFEKQMAHFLRIKMEGSNLIEQLYARYMPVPFLSTVTNDCIARGKDYNAGGARYNTSYIQGVGIGTITDCLAAIKTYVYDTKQVGMERLMAALQDDFSSDEWLLRELRDHAPKYGNDDPYADSLMVDVFESYRKAVTGRPNARGGHYRVNMLPTTCHVYFGEVCIASANGRRAGKPLSEGISPSQGADTCGPTAVLMSAAKLDHLQTGGTLLNQKFSPSALQGEAGLRRMADLILAYFAMDGHHIQFNVVDRETLLEAQRHPEEHRDLIVRVAGYSDYFGNLGRALQDEIINRTEHQL